MQHKLLPRVVKLSEILQNIKREKGTEIDGEREKEGRGERDREWERLWVDYK